MRPLSIYAAYALFLGLSGGAHASPPDRTMAYGPGSACRITGSVNGCTAAADDTRVPLLFFLGDSNSVTAKYEGSAFHIRNTGYPAWVAPMVGQRVRAVLPTDATSGFTCGKVLSVHVPAVIANAEGRPSIAAVMCGTNDILVGIPFETTIATLDQIYAALEKAGIRALALPIYPHAAADQPAYDAAKTAEVARLNAWIAQRASRDPGMSFVDYGRALLQPGSALARSSYFYSDGRHTIAAGAMIVARAVARVVDRLVPAGGADRENDLLDRTADGWSVSRRGGVALRDGAGDPGTTVATLSGRADGSTTTIGRRVAAGWAAGDAVEAEVTISWTGLAGVEAVYLGVSANGARPFASYDLFGDAISGALPSSSNGELVLRTAKLAIPPGTTGLEYGVFVRTANGGTAAGSITMRDAGLYRRGQRP